MNCYYNITEEPIDFNQLTGLYKSQKSGGAVIFLGTIRDNNQDKKVDHLFYEAHVDLANKMIQQILEKSIAEFNLDYAIAVHRTGKLIPGEIAVAVITFSKHRKEAYNANQVIIHSIKHEAPIWKKEIFADGTSVWGNNCNC